MLYEINNLPVRDIIAGFHARFIHTESMTLAFVEIDAGSILPEHAHFHEQCTRVIKGELALTIDGETHIYTQGQVAVIPAHVPHSARALTACTVMDVFSPVREDYR
jgi:quercetin dioxygenase-like cupin family protein